MPSGKTTKALTGNDFPQINLYYEKIVDNFSGGGGASWGIESATGRPVDAAINHDRNAILMHKTNHPHTVHYQEDVFQIDPYQVAEGHPIGLAWFSPTCTHFSRAKGLPLVDRHIRGLAWVILRWAMTVRPRVILMENVVEFQTWGPLMPDPKGRGMVPDPEHRGETFMAFIQMLSSGCKEKNDAYFEACEFLKLDPNGKEGELLLNGLGYDLDYRELVAADYGTPTIRKRFFMAARSDGKPIVWPEPTHAPRNSEAVKRGEKLPWRSAAEIIDWTLPCPSIFDTKEEIKRKHGLKAQRPLRPNTMRRVARGMDKLVLKSAKPFIIPRGYGEREGQQPRVHNIEAPLPTTVSTLKHALVEPKVTPWATENANNGADDTSNAPLHTVTPAKDLVGANLIQYHTKQGKEAVRGQERDKPLSTIDTSNRHGLVAASLHQFYGSDRHGTDIRDPLPTVSSHDHTGLQMAHLAKYYGGVEGASLDQPLPTVTAIDHNALVTTTVRRVAPGMELYHWPEVRALLNEYCGYNLTDDEILLLNIGGTLYFISDIGLRMLCPKELYAANGFPSDYIIDKDYLGNEYKPSQQVARCGNAVPPPLAAAMVRANLPEWCSHPVSTVHELHERISA